MPSLTQLMDQLIQIRIHDIGISIVNDVLGEEIFYISLNKSKVIWTETKRSRVRPFSQAVNIHLEELYRKHVEQCESNPDDKEIQKQKYQMKGFRV